MRLPTYCPCTEYFFDKFARLACFKQSCQDQRRVWGWFWSRVRGCCSRAGQRDPQWGSEQSPPPPNAWFPWNVEYPDDLRSQHKETCEYKLALWSLFSVGSWRVILVWWRRYKCRCRSLNVFCYFHCGVRVDRCMVQGYGWLNIEMCYCVILSKHCPVHLVFNTDRVWSVCVCVVQP